MTSALEQAATDQLDSMIEENMGLVVLIAKSFKPKCDDELDEYIQIGRIATWDAIQKHDPSKAKLSTIIWHYVRWAILRHLKKTQKNKSEIQVEEMSNMENNTACASNIWEFLPDSLTKDEKKVLKLRLEGNTFTDIGSNLGYSRGWANSIFRKATKKINNANKEKTYSNL